MPLDALCLRAVLSELHEQIAGSRIEKVYQPDREEVVLQIRGEKQKLLFSVAPSAPRIHFIEQNRENPQTPPMFCMLLRKHIQGAKIVSLTQPALERMAVLELDATNEMGEPIKRYLIAELMGKHSNLILKGEDGRILDAIRRIDGDISGKRQILPGLFYRMPPEQQNKVDPFSISSAGLIAALKQADPETRLDKWLLSCLLGFSPLLCRELAYRAVGDVEKTVGMLSEQDRMQLQSVFMDWIAYFTQERQKPYLLTSISDHAVYDFSCLPITQYENLMEVRQESSFSTLLSVFYEKKGQVERMRRKASDMLHTVTAAKDRLSRKLSVQQQELKQTHDREKYKRKGELISANFYQLEKGMRTAKVIDYYDPDCKEIEISLDARLTPQQNAQKYFKRYQKAKNAEQILTQQIEKGKQELDYLESVLASIGEAENEADLAQMREELVQTGVLSAKQQKGSKRQKPAQSVPYEYRTTDGFSVWVGKNNIQNDLLSMKMAWKQDMWFHTQKIHGSHVILVTDGKPLTNQAMTEAAMIAAYHSKARYSATVPVDYTEVRNLKKPSGAKPGFVIYHVYQTAFVTPDEALIQSLRVQ